MTPLLNQLSLYQSAQSFIHPEADPAALTRKFYRRLFGTDAERLNDLLPLFEIIPDWGNYNKIDLPRSEYHARMAAGAELLRALEGKADNSVPFNPSPEEYRKELLFFFELFRDLSGDAPDFDTLTKQYWKRVYAIYDSLPKHVDPRPYGATERLVRFFDPKWTGPRNGPLPGKWSG
jgi:hypothetical protein